MPTYEFRCPNGHTFERFYRSIGTSEAQTACPECGEMAERLVSGGAGLLFKGSGFYLTDYGKNAHQKKAPTDNKSEGAKNESGKSESASGSGSGASESSGASKPSESKASESKPAAPPKASGGE